MAIESLLAEVAAVPVREGRLWRLVGVRGLAVGSPTGRRR